MGDQVAAAENRTYQPVKFTYWLGNVILIGTYLKAGRNRTHRCTKIPWPWEP